MQQSEIGRGGADGGSRQGVVNTGSVALMWKQLGNGPAWEFLGMDVAA